MAVCAETRAYRTHTDAACRCLAWEFHDHTCKAPRFLGRCPGQGRLRGGRSRAKQVRVSQLLAPLPDNGRSIRKEHVEGQCMHSERASSVN